MTAVSVVLPARDAAGTIRAALAALGAQELDAAYEVIVVDNGSEDETAELAERSPHCDRLIRRRRGEGPGAARNDGAAAASGPVLAFTDADCRPAPDWLAAGLRALEHADLVQGRVEAEPGAQAGPYDRALWVVGHDGLYQTANLFVRANWFDRLGGFEDWVNFDAHVGAGSRPGTGRPFGEDVWFAWRARRAGAAVAFSDEALVHHAVFPGSPGGFVAERGRLRYFPALAARIPELRDTFLHRRWFLSARSARFDLALAGLIAAATARRAAPLVATLPYLRLLGEDLAAGAGTQRRELPLVALAADAVGLAALVRGSLEHRSLVL
jgi:glycosyltransferase involved in cell wall biosynthesis